MKKWPSLSNAAPVGLLLTNCVIPLWDNDIFSFLILEIIYRTFWMYNLKHNYRNAALGFW